MAWDRKFCNRLASIQLQLSFALSDRVRHSLLKWEALRQCMQHGAALEPTSASTSLTMRRCCMYDCTMASLLSTDSSRFSWLHLCIVSHRQDHNGCHVWLHGLLMCPMTSPLQETGSAIGLLSCSMLTSHRPCSFTVLGSQAATKCSKECRLLQAQRKQTRLQWGLLCLLQSVAGAVPSWLQLPTDCKKEVRHVAHSRD